MNRPLSFSRQAAGLLGWLVLAFATGALGASASVHAAAFYAALVRPVWAPPAWLFGPVWSVLYALMGFCAWWVWRASGFIDARSALIVFIVQLAFNALWSWLFFVWHQGRLAFTDVVLLWILIVATIALFRRSSVLAAMLLLPYLVWVTFATALTFVVWRLNSSLLG